MDQNVIALHHYKILCEENPDGSNLNNIAILYDHFKMPSKSVKSLVKAIKYHKETLASSNLANKYIKEGFLDDAQKVLLEAKETQDYHKNVDYSLQRIAEKTEEEQELETKTLEPVQPERKFLINDFHL